MIGRKGVLTGGCVLVWKSLRIEGCKLDLGSHFIMKDFTRSQSAEELLLYRIFQPLEFRRSKRLQGGDSILGDPI